MPSIESTLVMARVLATVAAVMTPEQRAQATAAVRALPGDDAEREFFAAIAGALEQFPGDA